MLTRAELRKLAKAARDLAMECVAGTAPDFGRGTEFHCDGSPCCALGHVVALAGFRPNRDRLYAFEELFGSGFKSKRLVTDSNDYPDRRETLPWALLSLADELDAG